MNCIILTLKIKSGSEGIYFHCVFLGRNSHELPEYLSISLLSLTFFGFTSDANAVNPRLNFFRDTSNLLTTLSHRLQPARYCAQTSRYRPQFVSLGSSNPLSGSRFFSQNNDSETGRGDLSKQAELARKKEKERKKKAQQDGSGSPASDDDNLEVNLLTYQNLISYYQARKYKFLAIDITLPAGSRPR